MPLFDTPDVIRDQEFFITLDACLRRKDNPFIIYVGMAYAFSSLIADALIFSDTSVPFAITTMPDGVTW